MKVGKLSVSVSPASESENAANVPTTSVPGVTFIFPIKAPKRIGLAGGFIGPVTIRNWVSVDLAAPPVIVTKPTFALYTRFVGRVPAGIARLVLLAGKFVTNFTVAGDEMDIRPPAPEIPVTSTRIEFVEPPTGVFVHATHEIVSALAGSAIRRLCAIHVPTICGACTG